MISVADLQLRQGQFSLAGISFTIPAGRYGVLMGQTGSGKTTLLEAIAGLRPIAAGSIKLAGIDVTYLPPAARQLGYVPQDAALFRSLTVRENLAFALDVRKAARDVIERRVHELSDWLGVRHLLDRTPHGLSGGEAQRVALGRALAFHPRILLLDEPLSSLDEDTRDQLHTLLESLKQTREVTVLHVTHSRKEAERLGDVVLRLADGKVTVISISNQISDQLRT
jgi:molybdate/tungstate transport system ATP-binding protein